MIFPLVLVRTLSRSSAAKGERRVEEEARDRHDRSGCGRTDQGLLGGLPREVADVAAAALGGGLVTHGAVTAGLGRGGLGGRLVLTHGDVAIAEGVAW